MFLLVYIEASDLDRGHPCIILKTIHKGLRIVRNWVVVSGSVSMLCNDSVWWNGTLEEYLETFEVCKVPRAWYTCTQYRIPLKTPIPVTQQ